MRMTHGVSLGVAVLALAGCGQKLQCHDDEVAITLRTIVLEDAVNQSSEPALLALLKGSKLVLSGTVEKNRTESGAIACTGHLSIDFSNVPTAPEQIAKGITASGLVSGPLREYYEGMGQGSERLDRLDSLRQKMPAIAPPGVVSWDIQYTVEPTSDKKSFQTALQDAADIGTYLAYYAQTNQNAKTTEPAKAATELPKPASRNISCSDISRDGQEKMQELAQLAQLPDGLYSRYHEDAVYDLCKGNVDSVRSSIDDGYVKNSDVESIKRVLGLESLSTGDGVRSEKGELYGESNQKFIDMGLCNACAANVARHLTDKSDSRCGKLARKALEGNAAAVDELSAYPDYCVWKD